MVQTLPRELLPGSMAIEPQQSIQRLVQLIGPMEPGTVSLVGAGPGDSALISIRGAVRLTQADVVLHDKLVGAELLTLIRRNAERIFVGKWRGQHSWTQDQINEALLQHAQAGKRVVRLKGGDPFVFGRGGEECECLARAGIGYEVIPGITAAFGAPATAGVPLTHRGLSRSFTLVTGHADPDDPQQLDFDALAKMETIAIYMGVKNLESNCRRLVEAGLRPDRPAAVIRWGTTPVQRTIVGTVGDIAEHVAEEKIDPPAMVLIGEVVGLRHQIEWFENRPLHGVTVAVTRAADQASSLSGGLIGLGAEVIEAPTIAIADPDDLAPVDHAIHQIAEYDWLVLTSANGVERLFRRIRALGLDARTLAGVNIAAVGSATGEGLESYGIKPDLIPPEAVGESLADALIAHGVSGRKILLLRAAAARSHLVDALTKAGAACNDVAVYQTICPRSLPDGFVQRLRAGEIDWITLTSPSSFQNLLKMLDDSDHDHIKRARLASIGPVTTRAVESLDYAVAAKADPHDVSGLVSAIKAVMAREQ